MASSLLVPMHLEAKVLLAPTPVPALDGGPFNEDAVLEPGIHLHWALPDALTRARFLGGNSPRTGPSTQAEDRTTLFPGVPDRWVVVRYEPLGGRRLRPTLTEANRGPQVATNLGPAARRRLIRTSARVVGRASPTLGRTPATPGPLQPVGPPGRSWTAWVVDARTGTSTPLDAWEPPADMDAEGIHTFAGILPSAADLGAPGWGVWDPEDQASFDPAVAAYYPTARTRFGFHDELEGVGSGSGSLSYSVMGWYAIPEHDPLRMAPDRRAALERWRFAWSTRRRPLSPVVADSVARAAYRPTSARVGRAPQERAARADTGVRAGGRRAGSVERSRATERAQAMEASVGGLFSAIGEASGVVAGLGHLVGGSVPNEMLLHGAVTEVPRRPPDAETPPFEHGQVRVYPSVKTAMAAVASLDESDELGTVEALLQSLDGQQAKTQSGVLDLPAALHALSFQSAPGRSRFFARIDLWSTRPGRWKHHTTAVLGTLSETSSSAISSAVSEGRSAASTSPTRGSGHWPQIQARSSASTEMTTPEHLIPAHLQKILQTAKPWEPTEAELDEWMADVASALGAAVDEAEAAGIPIDPTVVRVHDRRRDAGASTLGLDADGRGSDGASYWLDTQDRDAMRRLLVAAHGDHVGLPEGARLHEVPGPRWYRPWSPNIVITGHGRSFRFGEDGRFEASGALRCRLGGETLVSLRTDVGGIVLARNLVESMSALSTHPEMPPEARALAEEAALLDAGNASTMAKLALPGATAAALAVAEDAFEDAVHALLLLRDTELTPEHRTQIVSMVDGRVPSPVAFVEWQDPWDPLFLDVAAAHPFSSLESDWSIDGEEGEPAGVEYQPLSQEATAPPSGQVELVEERSLLTSTIVHTLESQLLTKLTVDKYGNPIPAGAPPGGVDGDTFKKMAVLSAPLTTFDRTLVERGRRERTGALRLNRLSVVDAFGIRRDWDSGIPDPASTGGDETLPWWTPLPPRLPFWSRLQFRLMSAEEPGQEATFKESPLCGFLIPDLFEHALEVYDSEGRALGQLRSDPPQRGSDGATALDAWFEVHPWTADAMGLGPEDDPLDAVLNPQLRAFVAGVAAQGGVEVPPDQPDSVLFETGQTALMRILDTLRASVAPQEKLTSENVRLVGDAIAILSARVWLEATEETAPQVLLGTPPQIPEPPEVPTVRVQIGDQNRPDDGVLGVFLPDPDPSASRFAPVDTEAAEAAILNELPAGGISHRPAEHPFVHGLESAFPIHLGEPMDLTVLVEAGAGLYAMSGALPRKKITVPREFLAGVERLEPTFRVGPLLSTPTLGSLRPLLPAPQVEGREVRWLRYEPGTEAEEGTWEASPVPPLPPLGVVPGTRIRVSEGWMRLVRPEPEEG